MTERDEMVECAAKSAFKQAQHVYRLDHDRFPLKNTWEGVDESIRDGWRAITKAALRVGAPPIEEEDVAKALAPYFQEGFTARDGARAVMLLLGTRSTARTGPDVAVKPLVWHQNGTAKSIFGNYKISAWDGGSFTITRPGHYPNNVSYESEEAAKAAAQADYEQRIRSAITATVGPAEPGYVAVDPLLAQRCSELLEWSSTGLLNGGEGGKVRELANELIPAVGPHNALAVAEKHIKDDAMREVVRIAALPAPATASAGWQDIETAPRDGTWVILYDAEQYRPVHVRNWRTAETNGRSVSGWWDEYSQHRPSFRPTHWMPLPAAPTITRKSEERV